MPPTVTVTAPSRLHFGMLAFGQPEGRQFGGAGVMLEAPAVKLRVTPAAEFEVTGPLAARARDFARRATRRLALSQPPRCRIEILSAPPAHVGLGVGTQLGLSIAAALNALEGGPPLDAAALARSTGRAERSSVGTHGFLRGGLIAEAGQDTRARRGAETGMAAGDDVGPLIARIELPVDWRFVLIRPGSAEGLSGPEEHTAFDSIPPVPVDVSRTLRAELDEHLLPAAREGRFPDFGRSLYRYGLVAGKCFAAAQGGPFAGERLARLVEVIRRCGIEGVGQSSWGPTLFALVEDEAAARRFVARIREEATGGGDLSIDVARPARRGAAIEAQD